MSELTFERILELFAESDRRVAEQRLELERQFLLERNEREKQFKKQRKKQREKQREEREEREKQKAEEDRIYKKDREESAKLFDLQMAQINKKIADLGDTLGRFAEEQVRADIMNKFNAWNIPVHALTNHFIQRDENNDYVYEVDILIYNSLYVVALEVKNTLRKEHVDEHIERMSKMQKYPLPATKGKILLAGVAGMIVGEGVDNYAEKKGLFVLKPSGDMVEIVNDQKTFKPREWVVE